MVREDANIAKELIELMPEEPQSETEEQLEKKKEVQK